MSRLSHLNSAKESYFTHGKSAFKYSIKLFYAGLAAMIHMIFPQWHQNTASNIAKEIYNDVSNRHNKAEGK